MTPLVGPFLLLAALLQSPLDEASRDYREEQWAGETFDWSSGTATGFLELLQAHPRRLVLVRERHRGFVREADLPALMERLDSAAPCAVVMQPISAHIPQHRSSVGHEAALMVEAFWRGEDYPVSPASDLHHVDLVELRRFWELWKALAPPRAPGREPLQAGVAYVDEFRAEGGWHPLSRLPAPLHHGARLELTNLADFPRLRWRSEPLRVTFRVLESVVEARPEQQAWLTIYRAEVLRVE